MTSRPIRYPESAYQTVVLPEVLTDGRLVYVANHPELRGCRAQADSPEHALENLSEVFESYSRHFVEHGLDMPAPQQKPVHEVVWRSAAMVQANRPLVSIHGPLGVRFGTLPDGSSSLLGKSGR